MAFYLLGAVVAIICFVLVSGIVRGALRSIATSPPRPNDMSVHNKGRGPGHMTRSAGAAGGGAFLSPSVIAFDSAAGWTTGQNPPAISVTLPNDGSIQVGDWYRIEYASNVNFTGSSFGNWYQITSADVLNNGVTGTAYPWGVSTLPAGATWFRAYMGRGANAGAITLQSVPSNVITDTLATVGATTVWTTTNGVNKNQNMTVSGTPALVATGPGAGFNNAPCFTRSTQAATGKKHWEVTFTTKFGNNPEYIGMDDGTTAVGPGSVFPNPMASFNGVRYDGTFGWEIYKNGAIAQSAATPVWVQGDVITIEFDTVGGTFSVYRNGVQLGTTVTGVSMANWYAVNGLEEADVFTANFGQNAFTMTPSTGYTAWP